MAGYFFLPQFAGSIENGTKTSTIRRRREAKPVKAGDVVDLFCSGPEQRWITTVACSSVTPITITPNGITLGGRKLTSEEELILAQKDGFVSVAALLDFVGNLYGLPTEGLELISWEVRAADSAPLDNTARLQCGRCQREVGVHEQCQCRTERAPVEVPTIEPCLYCGGAMASYDYDSMTYLVCEREHSFGMVATPENTIAQYNLIASNYTEAMQSLPLHAATIARQASMIEGLRRQIKKLEKQSPSPPPAVAPEHRLEFDEPRACNRCGFAMDDMFFTEYGVEDLCNGCAKKYGAERLTPQEDSE